MKRRQKRKHDDLTQPHLYDSVKTSQQPRLALKLVTMTTIWFL